MLILYDCNASSIIHVDVRCLHKFESGDPHPRVHYGRPGAGVEKAHRQLPLAGADNGTGNHDRYTGTFSRCSPSRIQFPSLTSVWVAAIVSISLWAASRTVSTRVTYVCEGAELLGSWLFIGRERPRRGKVNTPSPT